MLAVSVGGETGRHVEARLAAGDDVEHATRRHRADHLADDIRQYVAGWNTPAREATQRHRRIEMGAGNVPDGVRHRQHGEAEGQGYTGEADAQFGKGRGEHRASATTENQPEGTKE